MSDPSHDGRIAQAYLAGLAAGRSGLMLSSNPYYFRSEEWFAWESGLLNGAVVRSAKTQLGITTGDS